MSKKRIFKLLCFMAIIVKIIISISYAETEKSERFEDLVSIRNYQNMEIENALEIGEIYNLSLNKVDTNLDYFIRIKSKDNVAEYFFENGYVNFKVPFFTGKIKIELHSKSNSETKILAEKSLDLKNAKNYISKYERNANYKIIMMLLLTSISIQIVGSSVLGYFCKIWDTNRIYQYTANPIVGIFIWCIISSGILIVGFYYSLITVIVIFLMCLWILYNLANIKFDFEEVKYITKSILIWSPITLFFIIYNYSYMTYDSFYFIVSFGKQIAASNSLNSLSVTNLVSYGLFIPVIESLGQFVGFDYFYPIYTICFCSFLITSIFLIKNEFRERNEIISISISIIYSVIILTTPMIMIQSKWIITNNLIGIYTFCSYYAFKKYKYNGSKIYLLGSYIGLIPLLLGRIEGPIFILLFLFIYSFFVNHNKFFSNICLVNVIITNLLYFRILSITGMHFNSDFVSVERMLIISMLSFLFWIYSRFLNKEKYTKLTKKYVPKIAITLVSLAILVLNVSKWEICRNVVKVMTLNLFLFQGGWGIIWLVYFLIIFIVSIKDYNLNNDVMLSMYLVYMFFGTLFIMLCFSKFAPRIGIWDSSNRITVHVVYIVIYELSVYLSLFLKEREMDNLGKKIKSICTINR